MSLKLTNTLKLGKSLIILILCCISIYEYILGFLQITGLLPYGHTNFAMTGTFENPGVWWFDGNIACDTRCLYISEYNCQNKIWQNSDSHIIIIVFGMLQCTARLI